MFQGSQGRTRQGRRHGAAVPANAQVRAASGHGRGRSQAGRDRLPGWGLGRPPVWRPSPPPGRCRGRLGSSVSGGMPKTAADGGSGLMRGDAGPDGSWDLRGRDYLLSRLGEGKVTLTGYKLFVQHLPTHCSGLVEMVGVRAPTPSLLFTWRAQGRPKKI